MAYMTAQDMQNEIEGLALELGLSVDEALNLLKNYVDSADAALGGRIDASEALISALRADTDANAAAITAITEMSDNGVESLAEKVKALNDMFTEDGDLATDVLNRIANNASAIATETTNRQADTANLQAQINADKQDLVDYKSQIATEQAAQDSKISANETGLSTLINTVAANKTASEAADSALEARIVVNEGDLSTLKSDKTVEGSVAYAVEQEAVRAKAAEAANRATSDANIATAKTEAIAAAKVESDKVAADVAANKTAQDAINTSVQAQLDANDGELAVLNGDETVEGSVAKAVADAKTVLDAKDADLQAQIDALGTGSITDLTDRVTVLESDMNDTVDANGDVVKGVKTKVADLEAGLVANQADQDAKDAATNARIDALNGSGLETGVMCYKKAANKFRGALTGIFAQTLIDEDCGTSGDGGTL
jgi:hypothetical protein